MKTHTGKQMIVACGIIVILTIFGSACAIEPGGLRDNILEDDPNVGRVVNFDLPMAYSMNCVGCGGSKRSLEINRDLLCIEELSEVGSHLYKDGLYDVNYVSSEMMFVVKEVDRVEPYGFQTIGGEPYTLAILEDENGLSSTVLMDSIDDDNPCLNGMTPHLEKLFRYLEENGKARILATVFDLASNKSDKVTQQFSFHSLKTLPAQYHADNLEMMASSIPGMLGVAVDINAISLVYLVSAQSDLKIWEITGLDAVYLNSLTEADQAEIRGVPISLKL